MRIRVQDLSVGDVLSLNDWKLHVVGVQPDTPVGVAIAEFDFLLHFQRDEIVSVQAPLEAA